MYRNILVPLSFEADRDAAEAITIARALCESGGSITVLHVLEYLPQYASDLLPDDHLETARHSAIESLSPLVKDIENAKVVVVEGHPARGVLDFAQSNDKDCIVIASHRPGMKDLLIGTTAARVVRHAQCAVHVVR